MKIPPFLHYKVYKRKNKESEKCIKAITSCNLKFVSLCRQKVGITLLVLYTTAEKN